MSKQLAMLGWALALALIAAAAVAGLMLGAGAAPALVLPTAGITPRTLAGATTRTTPQPSAPTRPPVAPDQPEPLPPLIFARAGQIWQSDGGSGPQVQLTRLPGGESASQPALSPDGARIAFVTLLQPPITATVALPGSRLYVLERDNGALRVVWQPESGILWLPSWSHDGAALYLLANGVRGAGQASDTDRLQVVRIDLATGAPSTIVRGALDPCVSPDGTQLAYLAFDADGVHMHLELSGVDGSNPRRIIDGGQFQGFFAPRFSPDGRQLIVAGLEGPATDEAGLPLAARPRGLLDALLGVLEPPSAEAHGAPWDVWIVNADGSGLRRLAHIADDMPMGAFSPDGRELVIMAYNGFYRLDRDGSRLRRIDPHSDHGGIAWDTRPR
jgi:Tol biopolymer transport system component